MQVVQQQEQKETNNRGCLGSWIFQACCPKFFEEAGEVHTELGHLEPAAVIPTADTTGKPLAEFSYFGQLSVLGYLYDVQLNDKAVLEQLKDDVQFRDVDPSIIKGEIKGICDRVESLYKKCITDFTEDPEWGKNIQIIRKFDKEYHALSDEVEQGRISDRYYGSDDPTANDKMFKSDHSFFHFILDNDVILNTSEEFSPSKLANKELSEFIKKDERRKGKTDYLKSSPLIKAKTKILDIIFEVFWNHLCNCVDDPSIQAIKEDIALLRTNRKDGFTNLQILRNQYTCCDEPSCGCSDEQRQQANVTISELRRVY